MKLCLDTNKCYAIALEGGGAKGAYHIGVWQALEEAGIRYCAVAGTSVGALNGAMMCMRDMEMALDIWSNIRLSDVIAVDEQDEEELHRLFSGEAGFSDLRELLPRVLEVIRNRGLDIGPLRAWVQKLADPRRIRESDVDFFVTTVSLTDRKAMDVHINALPEEEIGNMLLASAYHPSFRQEPLGGKHYADGGLVDSLPLYPLVQRGYKDIIGVRIPVMGRERRFRVPEDVNITIIDTDSDLGGILNFDARQSRRNLKIGYYDAKRVLYGLYGRNYYIDRSLSEEEALRALTARYRREGESLRRLYEKELPRISRRLDAGKDDYYALFLACLERQAEEKGLERLCIYRDTELMESI